MLDDFKLIIMLCHFFYDANASMIWTINSFKSNQSMFFWEMPGTTNVRPK